MRVVAGPLDDWTTDQLFAEVLRRKAQDGRALREIHDVTLRARLDAQDRTPPPVSS
jgi:hypothetical protein